MKPLLVLASLWGSVAISAHPIVQSLDDRALQRRLSPLLEDALEVSEQYGLDPYWFLAVMMVESHFDPQAQSPSGAIGVMQVMPATAREILFEIHPSLFQKESMRILEVPRINMEVGGYYLKKLLLRFRFSYKHAIIAYNMGPLWVQRRLAKRGGKVGERNVYWNKVRRAYDKFSEAGRREGL